MLLPLCAEMALLTLAAARRKRREKLTRDVQDVRAIAKKGKRARMGMPSAWTRGCGDKQPRDPETYWPLLPTVYEVPVSETTGKGYSLFTPEPYDPRTGGWPLPKDRICFN